MLFAKTSMTKEYPIIYNPIDSHNSIIFDKLTHYGNVYSALIFCFQFIDVLLQINIYIINIQAKHHRQWYYTTFG